MRALFFDGGGGLDDGVGDHVEGVHVDEDGGDLDGDEFGMGAADDDIEEVSDFEVFTAFNSGVSTRKL